MLWAMFLTDVRGGPSSAYGAQAYFIDVGSIGDGFDRSIVGGIATDGARDFPLMYIRRFLLEDDEEAIPERVFSVNHDQSGD